MPTAQFKGIPEGAPPELVTAESVAEGHPDKMADRISDEILDAYLRLDPKAHVAIETLVTADLCVVAGEVRAPPLALEPVVRQAIRDIGYTEPPFGWDSVEVRLAVHAQSPEIARGVDSAPGKAEGAGDQGIMVGYACRETPDLMPAPIHYAHRLMERMARLRRGGRGGLGPDGKSQVTLEYRGHRPVRAEAVVLSQMHVASLSMAELRGLAEGVVREVLPDGWVDGWTRLLVNPAGTFVLGGPAADTGLTGRKNVVDSYGPAVPHGGGAYSGKDPSKVDRSASYAARWVAKNVVAAGLSERCLLQIAYAIGVAEPLAVQVDCLGTGALGERSDERIASAVRRACPLTPRWIRDRLGLDRPIYARTAAYGHFGRPPDADGGFSWERLDLAETLLESVRG
jgi:S-adenosylmethionine synthetase